jgi:hypothetical protein
MTDRSYLPPEHVDLLQTPPAAYQTTPERVLAPYAVPTDAQLARWMYATSVHEEVMAMMESWAKGHTMDTEQKARFEHIRDGYPR